MMTMEQIAVKREAGKAKLSVLEQRRRSLSVEVVNGDGKAVAEMETVERQIQETKVFLERSGIAEEEARTRAEAVAAEARAVALHEMTEMLGALEAKRDELIKRAKTDLDPSEELLEEVYVVARQAYSLSHDLHGVTGDHRFRRTWDLRLRLGEDLAARCPGLNIPAGLPKPPIPNPWAALLEIVRHGAERGPRS